MDIDKTFDCLKQIVNSSKILKNEPMKKHTSFKIGGNADILVSASTIEEVRNVVNFATKNDIPIYIMGNGSNILVKDEGIRGIVLKNNLEELEFLEEKEKVVIKVGAGVKLAKLAQELLKKEITGFEFASRNSWHNRWSS